MNFDLISRHYTERGADRVVEEMEAKRKKMRSSGAQRFTYEKRRTGKSFPRRKWQVIAR